MNSFLETLKQLGPARLGIMGGVLAGLLLFFVFVSMRISTPNLKMLYTDLSTSDSGAMAAKLEEAKIPYDVSPDGTRISVPSDDIGRARMLLAADGLPNGGSMGYEIFDKQAGFGATNFVQNINQVRALEGELARTIGALEQIRSARVHLVLPQRELFSRESEPASASVFITARPGARLEHEQIMAIQSLVASAVPQLKPDKVAIIDSAGNLLARSSDDDAALAGEKGDEMQRSYETRTSQTVEDIIGRVVGPGKVRANVSVVMDFDKITTNQELFDPDQQVVRSSQTVDDKSSEHEKGSGDVSVQNNLPGISPDLLNDKPTSEANRTEETTNYEIGKTVRSTEHSGGEIKHQSVAVLVDGNYTTDDKGKKTYTPRSDDEIKKISDLVKTAIGFDEKRGDTVQVVNMQFADIESEAPATADDKLLGFEKTDLLDAVEIITVAIMIILVILLVIQPMVGRLLTSEGPALGEELENELLAARIQNPALMSSDSLRSDEFRGPSVEEDDSLIDMQAVEGKVKASSVKKVEDIVENYPAETVSVLRSWMSQEDHKGFPSVALRIREDYRTLSGPEKAAIFMLALGEEYTAKIFEHMDTDEILEISQTMAGLGKVSANVVERLFIDFAEQMSSTNALVGTLDSTERLLVKVLGKEKVSTIMEEIRGPAGRTMWEKLGNVNEEILANFLQKEYPQTVAVVMSKVQTDHAARVLALLPENFALEVIHRMLRMEAVQKEVLEDVEKTLRTEFMANLSRSQRRDSHELMAEIFNNLDRTVETKFMDELEKSAPESAEKIRSLMFTFEDLLKLDPTAIQTLIRAVDKDKVPTALKGATEALRDLFFSNMSERAAKIMKEDMAAMGPVRLKDVEEAQQYIVGVVKDLESRGEIVIASGDAEDELIY